MSKHTPGPWWIFEDGHDCRHPGVESGWDSIIVYGSDDDAGVRGETPEIALANARLIAAAPEMFELLKEFEAFTQGQFAYPLGSVQRLREIIAKAEGSDAPR